MDYTTITTKFSNLASLFSKLRDAKAVSSPYGATYFLSDVHLPVIVGNTTFDKTYDMRIVEGRLIMMYYERCNVNQLNILVADYFGATMLIEKYRHKIK